MVPAYGSLASEFLRVSKRPKGAVTELHNDARLFCAALGSRVKAVLTDNDREFCGSEKHRYEFYFDFNSIEHRRAKVPTPKANDFVERLNGTALNDFFHWSSRLRGQNSNYLTG